jgi:hypothetical protein
MSKSDNLNLSNNEKIFNKDDFVYFKGGNGIESSGYRINSVLMSENSPVMITDNINASNTHSQYGGNVSNLLNDFAVPAGLLLLQQKTLKHYEPHDNNNKDDVIKDDLFNKLLQLSTPIKNKKNTKRNNNNKNKKNKNMRKTKRKN